MPLHDRLRYARDRVALTGSQVRERTGIGESSLSDFENGKREPSLSQLQKLADLYRRSVSFFFAEGPILAEPAVLWRMRPQENAEEIEVTFLRLCEQYHNLEMWCDERAIVSVPPASGNPNQFSYNDAEELAKRVLRELPLGNWPGRSLLPVLQEVCGVKVFHRKFEPTGTAASAVSDDFGAAVLLNANNVQWRRNYDLAHELFHLLTWPVFHPTSTGSVVSSDLEESLANCFASSLLMPIEPFRSAINSREQDGNISFESLFDISREFDVSIDSLIWRMHFVYGRGKSRTEQTKQEIERAKQLMPLLHAEEREDQEPRELPARYHALAVKALRRGEMSIGRFAEYLNISRHEAMQFVQQETSDDEKVQVAPA
jgi:XRE family transcriptional regulator, fatty acid utilization regulator